MPIWAICKLLFFELLRVITQSIPATARGSTEQLAMRAGIQALDVVVEIRFPAVIPDRRDHQFADNGIQSTGCASIRASIADSADGIDSRGRGDLLAQSTLAIARTSPRATSGKRHDMREFSSGRAWVETLPRYARRR